VHAVAVLSRGRFLARLSGYFKALTMKTGLTHMMRYMQPLLDRVQTDEIDPSFVISHTLPLEKV
jgi:threonine dehydrogenase-like Zn-dependent dehydrogenase